MKIYLMRHGDANSAEQDPQRGLSEKGIHDIEKVARALKKVDAKPALIHHSGKRRAEQTAQIVREVLDPSCPFENLDGIKPNGTPSAILPFIQSLQQDTMLVSHLPFLPSLVALLTVGSDKQGYLQFQTGSVVCLDSDDQQQWMISWTLTPGECE